MNSFEEAVEALISIGDYSAQRNWTPATSGNFSVRLPAGEAAITISGAHKQRLSADDVMRVDLEGRPLEEKRPSAETPLHVQLYRHDPAIGAVLHTHSVNATVVSRVAGSSLALEGLEIFKAFAGIATHEIPREVAVFDNDQDVRRLARRVAQWLAGADRLPGYLIAGHGLYAWGSTLADALRHVEAFEFLFQYELKLRSISK